MRLKSLLIKLSLAFLLLAIGAQASARILLLLPGMTVMAVGARA